MSILWALGFGLGIALEIAVIVSLLRGYIRRFPALLAYCVFLTYSSVSEALGYFRVGPHGASYATSYWINDLVTHALLVLVIAGLVHDSVAGHRYAKHLTALLLAAAVLVGVVSLSIYHVSQISRWMTPVSRNLSVCEEVLVFILWAILIRQRSQDQVLLLVSSGLGIQVTGEVIAQTLRLYSKSRDVWLPNILLNVSDLLCLIVWLWAFLLARAVLPPDSERPARQTTR